MSPEKEKILLEECPKLYKHVYGDPKQTCMAFGIECGDGWFDLIYDLSAKLEKLIDNNDTSAGQVKDLNFYLDFDTEEMEKLVIEAERKSSKICETCGSTKEVSKTKQGWVKTLCKPCKNGGGR